MNKDVLDDKCKVKKILGLWEDETRRNKTKQDERNMNNSSTRKNT